MSGLLSKCSISQVRLSATPSFKVDFGSEVSNSCSMVSRIGESASSSARKASFKAIISVFRSSALPSLIMISDGILSSSSFLISKVSPLAFRMKDCSPWLSNTSPSSVRLVPLDFITNSSFNLVILRLRLSVSAFT